jgi:hypothetical protein
MARWPAFFAQPYISPPDYDTVEVPSKKEILLVQQSAADEYQRYSKATRWLGEQYRRSKAMLVA